MTKLKLGEKNDAKTNHHKLTTIHNLQKPILKQKKT